MSNARGLSAARTLGCAALVVLISAVTSPTRADQNIYGGFGPEGARMREQLWILPSGDAGRPMRATVFRPPMEESQTDAPKPLVVINHGTDEATRLAVAMPIYYWLSRWFVDRGYIVVLPQRRGHGATGGQLSESIGTCDHPDHLNSGRVAADDIASAVNFMTEQPFVSKHGTIVVGISTGGWASLALAARNLPQVEAIVNFAGGRGGHAYGQPNAVCGSEELMSAARSYASSAHEPTIWYYAKNDSYFGPQFAENLATAWTESGGKVEAHILPPYGSDGHTIADDRAGWDLWGPSLQTFLERARSNSTTVAKVASAPAETIGVTPIATSTLQSAEK